MKCTLKDKSVIICAKNSATDVYLVFMCITMYFCNLQCRCIVCGLSITHFLKNQNASMCQRWCITDLANSVARFPPATSPLLLDLDSERSAKDDAKCGSLLYCS